MKENLFENENRARNYARTAILILLKSMEDVLGKENINKVTVEFTIGPHYYILPNLRQELSKKNYADIWSRMHDYVDADLPIEKRSLKVSDIYREAVSHADFDAASFLHFRRSSRITVSCFQECYAYFYGSLLKSSGALKAFDLMPYDRGFFLLLPDMSAPDDIPPFNPPKNLFDAYDESYRTVHMLNTDTVTEVNKEVCRDHITDLILTCESMFDAKLALAANQITARDRKFVFIAGPSSSGKTSTAHRLSYALRSYGRKPRIISLDNYYRDRSSYPQGEGPDIESIDALDLEQFAIDMNRLLKGEVVDLPHFNFLTQKREYVGDRIGLGEKDILIIEGIHSLNPKFTEKLPEELIYKVYVSALSQLNIDNHNRIPSSDIRLLRRIVRDHRSRGYDAAMTIAQWPSVRAGEEKNIFPYQGTADIVINTAMVYELSAIKPYAERVLFCVRRDFPEYTKAKELLKFLDFVIPLSTDQIPPASIIREFIGGSCLNVG